MGSKLIVFTLLFFLLASSVTAWGILPARQLGSFSEDTQEFSFTLRNTDFSEGIFRIRFAGSLADYATYSGSDVQFSSDTSDRQITIQLELPDDLAPGSQRLRVLFEQIPFSSTSTLGSTITFVGEVVISVPFRGSFLEGNLFTSRSGTQEDALIELSLVNRGIDRTSTYADIVIKGPTNQEVTSWRTDSRILSSGDSEKIRTYWKGEKDPGVYFVEANVHYDDQVLQLSRNIIIGSKEVSVPRLETDRFRLGEINRLNLEMRSLWNEPLTRVFAEVLVLDDEGSIVQTFRTSPTDFQALQSRTLEAFWDTSLLETGSYTLMVISHVDEETSQFSFPITVAVDRLDITQPTGQVTREQESGGNTQSVLIVLVFVVLITNVMILLYFRKQKRK